MGEFDQIKRVAAAGVCSRAGVWSRLTGGPGFASVVGGVDRTKPRRLRNQVLIHLIGVNRIVGELRIGTPPGSPSNFDVLQNEQVVHLARGARTPRHLRSRRPMRSHSRR